MKLPAALLARLAPVPLAAAAIAVASVATPALVAQGTPAASIRAASASQSLISSTMPKCGTGTPWPSTGFVSPDARISGSRCATIWCP